MNAATGAIHADGVITGDREAIRDGAVLVAADGAVLEVGRAEDVLPRHAGAPVERVRGVVFPGLVNAHTHVELSALRGRVPGGAGFLAWVDRFVRARSDLGAEEEAEGILRAARELEAFATSAVGDVTNRLKAVHPLARRHVGGSVFHEVFGLALEPLRVRRRALAGDVESVVGEWPTRDLAYAAAPHTLYTTHAEGVRELLAEARARGRRTSLHFLEHEEERRAIEHGEGPMARWLLAKSGIAPEDFAWPLRPVLEFADALGALDPHVLLVHLVDARPAELRRLAARGSPVVLCPRSNLFIEQKLPPLAAIRDAGLEPALGTDSLASNDSLDVLAEARALADAFREVPARELVQMATHNGARALGRTDLGRIAKGARPGIAAVDGDVREDPCAFLLAHGNEPRRIVARRWGAEGGPR